MTDATDGGSPAWYIYKGDGAQRNVAIPAAPPWRRHETPSLDYEVQNAEADATFQPHEHDIAMVNAALYLRRPLLITGNPGTGKSSLARSVAHELGLGQVLVWAINSRSTLRDALYDYDALARLQDASRPGEQRSAIGKYIRLGALGTALLPREKPRVLLIDEIDKSDIDLPNDLLHVFERGSFEIPELTRASTEKDALSVTPMGATRPVELASGVIQCREFPLMVLTSNGEREFPPAFNRRCLRLEMLPPKKERLERIVAAHFGKAAQSDPTWQKDVDDLIVHFLDLRDNKRGILATDQLLNALHLVREGVPTDTVKRSVVSDAVLQGLVPRGTT